MNVQDLIGEVARRHNVLVDPEDPVFVAVTLNELLLAEHVQNVQAALDRAEQATQGATNRHLEKVRSAASALFADSSKHLAEQVRGAGSALRAQFQDVIRELALATAAAATEAARQRRAAEWAAAVAIGCACLVVGLAAVTWLGRP
jgi:VIT1/CCC1 family predicted Fe2+/Mn2+ transporter